VGCRETVAFPLFPLFAGLFLHHLSRWHTYREVDNQGPPLRPLPTPGHWIINLDPLSSKERAVSKELKELLGKK
jgi:hypothetical protein